MMTILDRAASVWSGWMWAMTWQAALFIAMIWCVDRLIRRWAWPQVCHALWLLVLLKLITPPWFAMPTSLAAFAYENNPGLVLAADPVKAPDPVKEGGIMEEAAPQAAQAPVQAQPIVYAPAAPVPHPSSSISWPTAAMLVWFAGVLAISVMIHSRWRALRRAFVEADSGINHPAAIEQLLNRISAELGLRRRPTLVFSARCASPAIFGPLRPVLILPEEFCTRAGDPALRYVLLHELAHVKRGDLLVQVLCIVFQTIYWFNPLIWVAQWRMQALRELCCDATVAGILKEETPLYRETLLNTAEKLLGRRNEFGLGLLGLVEQEGSLTTRLGRLEKQIWRHRRLRMATVFAAVVLAFFAVFPMAQPLKAAEQETPLPADANRMKAEMMRAYQSVSTYEVRLKISSLNLKTKKKDDKPFLHRFAFDRARNSFRYDCKYDGTENFKNCPVVAVCDGRHLWATDNRPIYSRDKLVERPKNMVMETTVSLPLDYESLRAKDPILMSGEFPLVALLLGQDLIEHIDKELPHGETPLTLSRVEPRADDPMNRPGLKVSGWMERPGRTTLRSITYWLDPKTHLATQVTELVATHDNLERATEAIEIYHDVETLSLNDPIDAGLFTFDTKGMKTVATHDDLFNAPTKPPKKKPVAREEPKPTGNGRIAGRVTDCQHKPVANCEVFFLQLGTGSVVRKFLDGGQVRTTEAYTYTDLKGDYVSPDLPIGEYLPYFNAKGLGRTHSTKKVTVNKDSIAQDSEQVLFPEIVYSGAAIDESGAPVANVAVGVVRVPKKAIEKTLTLVKWDKFMTQTDGQGRFKIERLPQLIDGDQYFIVFEHPSYITVEEVNVPPDKTDLKITMKRGYTAQGRVIDETGAPVEGAVVSAYWIKTTEMFDHDDAGLAFYKEAVSGKGGAFTIHGLRDNKYQFIARTKGKASAIADANMRKASATMPPLELTMLPCATVDVTVVDGKGKPIPNLKINFSGTEQVLWEMHMSNGHHNTFGLTRTTDAKGKARFEGIEDCEASLSVDQDEGYGRVFKKIGKIEPGKAYSEKFVVDTN